MIYLELSLQHNPEARSLVLLLQISKSHQEPKNPQLKYVSCRVVSCPVLSCSVLLFGRQVSLGRDTQQLKNRRPKYIWSVPVGFISSLPCISRPSLTLRQILHNLINQIKSNRIGSNQIESDQTKPNPFKSSFKIPGRIIKQISFLQEPIC